MTYKERLSIVKQDIKDKFPNLEGIKYKTNPKNIKQNTLENLHDLKTASCFFRGLATGAVKYSPYLFFAMSSARKSREKETSSINKKTRAKELYDLGETTGGIFSNLAIHGGTMAYLGAKENSIGILLYGGTLIGTNIIDRGCEYWRETGERVKEQKERDLEKEINQSE